MAIEISEMNIKDYRQIYALWSSVEGIGLHDYCDSESGIAKYLERNPGLSFIARDGENVVGSVLCGHDGRRSVVFTGDQLDVVLLAGVLCQDGGPQFGVSLFDEDVAVVHGSPLRQ